MSKICINIVIPSFGRKMELKVSRKIKIGELISKLQEYLMKENGTNRAAFDNMRLCDDKTGIMYTYNASLAELDICDGQEMLFI